MRSLAEFILSVREGLRMTPPKGLIIAAVSLEAG
jgi:hypothetical protein